MRGSENFLDKPAAELEELLIQVARSDLAPAAARDRALQNVASAALGVGVLSGTSAALSSRSSLFKGTSWLVAKWLALGASAGLLGIGVTQGVQELVTKSAPAPAPRQPPAAHAELHALAPSVVTLPRENIPRPEPETESEPARALALPSAPNAAFTAAAATAHEPKSASREPSASSAAAVAAPPPLDRRSSLTRELSLLEQARAALTQHSASSALQTLNDYHAEFPRGSMQIEAAALRVEAVGQSGDHALAQRLAQAFLSAFPTSPLAARVRAISEVSVAGAGEQKP